MTCFALGVVAAPATARSQQFVELPTTFVDVHVSAPVTGSVVYGHDNRSGVLKAARWSPAEGVTIINLADATTDVVSSCSGDGSVAVGTIGTNNSRRAFRYVHAQGGGEITYLNYAGSVVYSVATACSLNGEVVVGYLRLQNQSFERGFIGLLKRAFS